ncbi:MAG: phosphoribosyltransferase family protein [Parcubacteria group bacterium]|jgi:orotate phosphoribosyltransferase
MDTMDLLKKSGAIVEGHLVFKAGTHGNLYIDKEQYANLTATELTDFISRVAVNAVFKGLSFPVGVKRVGVIGPAMGAIAFTLTLAARLEELLPQYEFFPARSELAIDASGNKTHVIPDKLMRLYENGTFVILEDIVNNGTTIREVKALFETRANAHIAAALCTVDRGGQTRKSLVIDQYYPLARIDMNQWDASKCPLCAQGVPIDTSLGKGGAMDQSLWTTALCS